MYASRWTPPPAAGATVYSAFETTISAQSGADVAENHALLTTEKPLPFQFKPLAPSEKGIEVRARLVITDSTTNIVHSTIY